MANKDFQKNTRQTNLLTHKTNKTWRGNKKNHCVGAFRNPRFLYVAFCRCVRVNGD